MSGQRQCPVPRCSKPVLAPHLYLCHKHWYTVSMHTRSRLWALYRPGAQSQSRAFGRYRKQALQEIARHG